jgi:hypothetical protein
MTYMSKFSSSPIRFATSLNSMISIEFNDHSILAETLRGKNKYFWRGVELIAAPCFGSYAPSEL